MLEHNIARMRMEFFLKGIHIMADITVGDGYALRPPCGPGCIEDIGQIVGMPLVSSIPVFGAGCWGGAVNIMLVAPFQFRLKGHFRQHEVCFGFIHHVMNASGGECWLRRNVHRSGF